MVTIHYSGPCSQLEKRQLLGTFVGDFHQTAIKSVKFSKNKTNKYLSTHWHLHLGDTLLFDQQGLQLLVNVLEAYGGRANKLHFLLVIDDNAYRDYYSLAPTESTNPYKILLPVIALKEETHPVGALTETLSLSFDYIYANYDYPKALSSPINHSIPIAMLLEYHSDYDLLFANQIAIFCDLNKQLRRSPRTWFRALVTTRNYKSWAKRISAAYTNIHPSAEVHPTAVIEGSTIGAHCHIGPHVVIRYSHLGCHNQVYAGAKIELSVLGDHNWIMHDLVLVRSHVENHTFLIHGPYQFSVFQTNSAAFATIMMDYRPDEKNIRVMTKNGLREYQGRFLGAVLREGAKSLGGSILSPGLIIDNNVWLSVDKSMVHRPKNS